MKNLNSVLDVLVHARAEYEANGTKPTEIDEAFNCVQNSIKELEEIKDYINKMGVVSMAMSRIRYKINNIIVNR